MEVSRTADVIFSSLFGGGKLIAFSDVNTRHLTLNSAIFGRIESFLADFWETYVSQKLHMYCLVVVIYVN